MRSRTVVSCPFDKLDPPPFRRSLCLGTSDASSVRRLEGGRWLSDYIRGCRCTKTARAAHSMRGGEFGRIDSSRRAARGASGCPRDERFPKLRDSKATQNRVGGSSESRPRATARAPRAAARAQAGASSAPSAGIGTGVGGFPPGTPAGAPAGVPGAGRGEAPRAHKTPQQPGGPGAERLLVEIPYVVIQKFRREQKHGPGRISRNSLKRRHAPGNICVKVS